MPPTEDAPLPERIGGYRILRLLGKGGMGAVFEAEQDNPRRTVALKVVNAGVLTDDLRRRFELEAQVLGHLHHPCIAQIYEAGMYESSGGAQPFFAMELIHGTPLLEYVTKHDLRTRERLGLIARICDGIQHAHQRGVIHRDLKPANILVDEEGQPKILDFGLARATDADLQASTLHTDIGQIMGTIPYMSPEQAAGDPSALDLRSDIYSLGVVAYRVLSGEMPYAAGGAQVLEALRVVQEEDARPLSSVNRSLRGDVDTIVGKALEKEPARRYPSASEFAADIRHFLNDEPITARPPSAIYQLRKFARRNKALVLGIAAVFIALLIGLFGTSRGFVKASAEAERANRSSDFFETILLGVNPAVAQGKDTELLRIILDETAERIDVELADYPTTKADIHSTMALAYFAISAYEAAAEHSRIAHELFTREKGPRHPDTILEERSIGTFLVRMGDYEQAEEIFASNLALSREVFGPDDARTHNLHAELAALYLELQRADEAADLYELVHSYRQREFGDDDSSTIIALNGLGLARLKQNRYEEAEALLREALETRRRVSGESHPETIKLTHNLAGVLSEQGRIDEAIQLYRDALERNREILGPDHDVTLGGQQNLAGALRDLGRFDEAAQLQLGVLESRYALLGREDPRTYTAEHKLALIYHKQRRDAEAEPLARHANQGLTATYGEEHTSTLDSLSNLMNVLTRTGQLDEADAIRARLLDLCVRVYGEEHSETLVVLNDLAVYHANAGRYAEAEPLARDALEKRRRVLGDDRVGTLQSLFTLATVCDKQGRHAEAVPLLAEFLVGWARIHGDGDAYAQRAASVMGENLGRFADLGPFESEVRTLTDYHRRALPPEAPELVQDLIHRGAVLTSLEQYGTAEEILLGASGEATRPGEKSQAARRLAQLYEATGDSAEAETWRARVDD